MRSCLATFTTFFMFATLFFAPDAEARRSRVERIYKGKIVLLKTRPPRRFSSQGRWLSFLRTKRLPVRAREYHAYPVKKIVKVGKRKVLKETRKWKIEFMAFFNRKLKDVEVKVVFLDISERGRPRLIESIPFYTQRDQTILASSIKLDRSGDDDLSGFKANRKYLMLVKTPRGKELARAKLWLRGKGERYSGKVTFSDEEAKLK